MLHRCSFIRFYSAFQIDFLRLAAFFFKAKQPAKLVPEGALVHVAGLRTESKPNYLCNWRHALMHPEGLDDDELEQIQYVFLLTPMIVLQHLTSAQPV